MTRKALAAAKTPETPASVARADGVAAVIERFLAAQDVKATSRETYARAIKPFVAWWQAQDARALTRDDILAYKRHLQARKLSSLTISAYLVVVRRFFEWAEASKLYPNVARGIKGAKRARGFRKDALTAEQMKELVSVFDRQTLQGMRDYAMIALLLRTGIRTIEAIRADVGDVRQQGGESVLWVHGKGRDSKDEFVVLTPEVLKPIHQYLAACGRPPADAPLFASLSRRNREARLSTRSVRRVIKDAFRAIGIDSQRLSAHSLRHSAITLALQAGATVQEAQRLGRHASIDTTLAYAHNIDRVGAAPEKKIARLLKELGVE